MTEVHLRAEGLACAVGGRVVVRGVELAVRTGEVLGLVGRNGSGNETTDE